MTRAAQPEHGRSTSARGSSASPTLWPDVAEVLREHGRTRALAQAGADRKSLVLDDVDDTIATMDQLKRQGRALLAGRLWHRLLLPGLPHAPAARPAQDRPVVCARPAREQPQRCRHRAHHHRHGAQPGAGCDRRRGGNPKQQRTCWATAAATCTRATCSANRCLRQTSKPSSRKP